MSAPRIVLILQRQRIGLWYEREPELEADIRRVVHVLHVLRDAESHEPIVRAMPESDAVLIFGAKQFVEVGLLPGVHALADVALEIQIRSLAEPVFATEYQRRNDLRFLWRRILHSGVVHRCYISVEAKTLPRSSCRARDRRVAERLARRVRV